MLQGSPPRKWSILSGPSPNTLSYGQPVTTVFLETQVTQEPCFLLGTHRRNGHLLQGELEQPMWVHFLGAHGEDRPHELGKQMGKATSQLLPGRRDHLFRPQVPGLSNATDTHFTESRSGMVTSQTPSSGDDQHLRSLLGKSELVPGR